MLETSKDILNISLAISAFGLAFILGWILIYFLLVIRHLVRMIQTIEERMKKIDDFITLAKGKLQNSSSYLSILAAGVKKLVSFFLNKKTRGSGRGS